MAPSMTNSDLGWYKVPPPPGYGGCDDDTASLENSTTITNHSRRRILTLFLSLLISLVLTVSSFQVCSLFPELKNSLPGGSNLFLACRYLFRCIPVPPILHCTVEGSNVDALARWSQV